MPSSCASSRRGTGSDRRRRGRKTDALRLEQQFLGLGQMLGVVGEAPGAGQHLFADLIVLLLPGRTGLGREAVAVQLGFTQGGEGGPDARVALIRGEGG